jgi:hypothetical protein
MDPYRYLPPDRRPRRRDFSLLFIFLLTLILMAGVVAILTAGWAWKPPSVDNPFRAETRSSNLFGVGVVERPAPSPSPSAAANTSLPAQPATATSAPATATNAPSTPTATGVPSTPTATATATPEPPQVYVVGNTNSVGAWLRRTPRMDDYLIAWVDNTRMEVVGPDIDANGVHWKNVRDPQGNVGYLPAQWLVPVQ